jgi:AcrR family transcriptional regulator
MRSASTPDRILEASLRLFNQHGFHNVPALRIAMDLGISPGHLAYHFKSKNDIVMALFPRIEQELNADMQDTTRAAPHMSPRVAAAQQIEVHRSLWRYRFVFDAMHALVAEDSELRTRHLRVQESIVTSINKLLDDLIERGDMRSVPTPNSTRLVSRSLWMLYLSWLRFEQIQNPAAEQARNIGILEGTLQSFSVLQPYLDAEFADQMLAELRAALAEDPAPAKARPAPARSRSRAAR